MRTCNPARLIEFHSPTPDYTIAVIAGRPTPTLRNALRVTGYQLIAITPLTVTYRRMNQPEGEHPS